MGGSSSWRSLLLRIGDKCAEYGGSTDYKEHVDTCYGVIWREMEHSKEEIFEFLLQCAEQLPHKIPFYGVLIGLINLEDEEFAKRVVDASQTILQEALVSVNCDRIRIIMRFLTGLMCSKVVLPGSIIEVFKKLLLFASKVVDDDGENPCQSCADFYVTCILSCLPWGGAELSEQVPEEVDSVMVRVESYLSMRRHSTDIGFRAFELDEVKHLDEKDFLEDLWDRIQTLSKNGWKADNVPRPHLSFEAQLVAGKSHNLSPICCPELPAFSSSPSSNHEAKLKYPQRLRRLNIFPPNKAEVVAGGGAVEAAL